MFTGIIEEIGKVKKVRKMATSASLTIECKKVLERNECRRQHCCQWRMFNGNKNKRKQLRNRRYARDDEKKFFERYQRKYKR